MSEKTFAEFERLTQQSAQLSLRLSEVETVRETLRKELLAAVLCGNSGVVNAHVVDEDSHGIPVHVHTEVTVPTAVSSKSAPEVNAAPKRRKRRTQAPKRAAPPPSTHKPGELRMRVLNAVHELKTASPMQVREILKDSTYATVNDAMKRYADSGWLKRVARGQYAIGLRAHAEG